ncbi:MAG TPA: Pls/PosA family non-ribosomal peptide synthetase [Jatrophihabitans sp.]|jgi:non-ribosomal peptide synthetase-like protein|uniref:Pls/PosA family non-ribosomal peptide synthetase n=1 Tax=Jatrophihabitans sp. TaxID=1932789 RepID=UPI002E0869C6|nr:Pls/PosA family non-ribosomal peptide synthetase [Jatrophihabitans sp.]
MSDGRVVVLGSANAAADPRTLIDILDATAAAHPDAPAIDDGTGVVTYRGLIAQVEDAARALAALGVARGERVGIRLPSGDRTLYLAILATLRCGAAYVPVDADDPDERARIVFGEASVGVVIDDPALLAPADPAPSDPAPSDPAPSDRGPLAVPDPADDAWIIFTSGSTGAPKGVAVSHRSAAAFVDAEARLFVQDAPIGPGDRVLAGLSVAFDASCEEMWLAWRHGACLVPAPRSLVRSGVDLGAWLVSQRVTVVSTVPTLAALWPQESLDAVRLLIFGGEACPPELAERLTDDGREVWNTYGPTEATVVACAALLRDDEPVRIGLPLDGWELAVVDADERPVAPGQSGQLIIGGVGLARYLDPAKDAEKYAPLPALGWERAYRSGDVVRFDPDGLLFVGRADDQVKVGGRRIELGEIDQALLRLDGVTAAAAAVRVSPAGTPLLVGYVVPEQPDAFDRAATARLLRRELPAALVPTLAAVDHLPTRTSGKIDRDALPWPLAGIGPDDAPEHGLIGTAAWLADEWAVVLGLPVTGPDDDFFAHGGGSLSAAQFVSRVRTRFPKVTVGDVYRHPAIGDLAAFLGDAEEIAPVEHRAVAPVPRRAQTIQIAVTALVATLTGLQWLTVLAALNNLVGRPWLPTASWWWVAVGTLLFLSPFGRMAVAASAARLLLRGVTPGEYPRGGTVHLRLWSAERLADAVGAVNLAGAPWVALYARALGARIGRGVDLHTVPPITGLLTLGDGCAIEPEVDLSGYWLDGDVLHVGRIAIGVDACIGARSTLGPGAQVGRGAQIDAGAFVAGTVPAGERWAGSPAGYVGAAQGDWPERPPTPGRGWVPVYAVAALVFALLPVVAALPGLLTVFALARGAASSAGWTLRVLVSAPLAAIVWLVVLALLYAAVVRLLGLGVRPGTYPVRSRVGWQVWGVERVMDSARTLLFPLYSSLATPAWLRLLGAQVGRNVEASTVLLQPRMTTVGDGAFLADDTMLASYELCGGWLRIDRTRVGKRAFLGNSGMAAPGRTVPKNGLVAVLSATPEKAKKGSSWLGSPPVRLRRSPDAADVARTFAPSGRVRAARALVELGRIVPTCLTVVIAAGVALGIDAVWSGSDAGGAALAGGLILLAAGAVAAGVTVAAKWLLVGRTGVVEHVLWSSFVWRNEVVDTFVEMVAAPWFARGASGTAVLNVFLRGLGASIGRGVWCESYWLPEADLVRLGKGVAVNRGCVVQTHLFHDRIMRMDRVVLDDGATLGPHCVILPAASLGAGTVVGPASLVMRGEDVPAGTRWIGNPIGPWTTQ